MTELDSLFSVLDVNTTDDLELSTVLAMAGIEADSGGCSCSSSSAEQPQF